MQLAQNQWYPVLECREARRRPIGVERLGVQLVFWRDGQGKLHAQNDRCPHMGASLSKGRVKGDCIACPFHGFEFDSTGRCTHAPALGRGAHIPDGLAARTYPVMEQYGLVWLWWGRETPGDRVPAFFPALEAGWTSHTISADWPVHYTRAIENQLDVSHLAFVHRTTIGAGGRSFVEGPHVESDSAGIRVWVTNRRDDGRPARSPKDLLAAAEGVEPGLLFLFPGVWLLNISRSLKLFIAFVPINDHCTRYYLRSYRRSRPGLPGILLNPILALSNRFILNQDRRVVVTQTPVSSLAASGDHLLGSDLAIIQYRRLLTRQLADNS